MKSGNLLYTVLAIFHFNSQSYILSVCVNLNDAQNLLDELPCLVKRPLQCVQRRKLSMDLPSTQRIVT